jgi:hypothetical protein
MRTDKTGTAGDKNIHWFSLIKIVFGSREIGWLKIQTRFQMAWCKCCQRGIALFGYCIFSYLKSKKIWDNHSVMHRVQSVIISILIKGSYHVSI